MPLILITGFPCSGKTTRANEIKEYFEKNHNSNVVLINEEVLSIKKDEAYKGFYYNKICFLL